MSENNGTNLGLMPFEFLNVNGMLYRCHKITGELWRLEPHPTEKKTQVWKKIEEPTVATH